jgi:hypothetical protein
LGGLSRRYAAQSLGFDVPWVSLRFTHGYHCHAATRLACSLPQRAYSMFFRVHPLLILSP